MAKVKTKAKTKAKTKTKTKAKTKTTAHKAPAKPKAKAKAKPKAKAKAKSTKAAAPEGVVLLSGGNPQIAKGDGDGPVQAYIAAMPGWKRSVGARLDELITRTVPGVKKAVRWNSPFYGVEGQGWFLTFHVFARYVKIAFLRGAALRPLPPGPSKDKHTRYLDLREDTDLDEAQLASWIQQAAAIPGWIP